MRLRIVTWNVGRLYSWFGDNRLDDRDLGQVARTLHELDGDVVLLQELVDREQLERLTALLLDYRGFIAGKCVYDRKTAVLIRRGLDLTDTVHAMLDPSGRGFVGVRFGYGGRTMLAASIHADAMHEGRRAAQVAALALITDGWRDDVVVVGGDFNLDPEWAKRRGPPSDASSFALLQRRFSETAIHAGPTLLGLLRVDHILVRSHRDIQTRAYRVSSRRLPLGDHDALVCDLEWL